MASRNVETPEHDSTVRILGTLFDGTVAGLARYYLWELQLREIRELPERIGSARGERSG
jgi:hypothetical protein